MKTALVKWRDQHQETTIEKIFAGEDEFRIQPVQ
jgi:hypothetical protein